MVKWTTLDSYTCLSESDSEQFTNFEFCEIKDHKHLQKKNLIYKAKQFVLTKNLKKIQHILEDSASGDIEQVIVKILFEI